MYEMTIIEIDEEPYQFIYYKGGLTHIIGNCDNTPFGFVCEAPTYDEAISKAKIMYKKGMDYMDELASKFVKDITKDI